MRTEAGPCGLASVLPLFPHNQGDFRSYCLQPRMPGDPCPSNASLEIAEPLGSICMGQQRDVRHGHTPGSAGHAQALENARLGPYKHVPERRRVARARRYVTSGSGSPMSGTGPYTATPARSWRAILAPDSHDNGLMAHAGPLHGGEGAHVMTQCFLLRPWD